MKESLGNEPHEQTKAGAIASANLKETKKGRKKAAKSKLHDTKELDVVSPQRSSEPRRQKRKVQKGPITSAQRTPRRSQEKPLGKLKAPRENRANKS